MPTPVQAKVLPVELKLFVQIGLRKGEGGGGNTPVLHGYQLLSSHQRVKGRASKY